MENDGDKAFEIGSPVIYRGKTYSFSGHVCGIADDGQYIVRAVGTPDGYYAGMKHIYGVGQLEAWDPTPSPAEIAASESEQAIARGARLTDHRFSVQGSATPTPDPNVRLNVDRLAASIVMAACELDGPADPAGADTISITMKDLEAVVHRHVTAAFEVQN